MADPHPSDEADTPAEPQIEPDERVMGFLDHLEELRWTLIKSLIVFLIAFIFMAIFVTDAAHLLNWPMERGMREFPDSMRFVTTTPFGVFSVFMMICFLGAMTLALPFILFFVAQFVAPAMTTKEKRLLIPACVAALLLFLAGSMFSFFLLAPSVMRVSAYLNQVFGTELLLSADRYYSMIVWMVLGMGAAFQFPMVIQILIYLGLLSVQKLRSWRRYAILVFFLAAAFITPTPDPLNQTMVAVPLLLLYELSIWVGALYTTRIAAESREASDEEGESQPG